MNNVKQYDVTVIGGGPAGLAAAAQAQRSGAKTLLIEREARTGGILKQCIHDGFGLVRFGEKLSGPEYAERFIDSFEDTAADEMLLSFVTRIEKKDGGFLLSVVNTDGVTAIFTRALILATGCRERTAKQVAIHGTRPAGVFTAGTAQHLTNIEGVMPTKRCVILGSGDIGLIMARRLTLEGAKVLGVYEAKSTPSGLTRNIHQCLHDYDIPLYLSKTVTRVFGRDRLEAVEICSVDEKMCPIEGTSERIECDALILSVGLIPENELAETLGVKIDPRTKGPCVDSSLMTSTAGVFSCGNALHVNDLVDYVSESGEIAGRAAANYTGKAVSTAAVNASRAFLYLVPQSVCCDTAGETVIYFRTAVPRDRSILSLKIDGKTVLEKKYLFLRPPEMERLTIDFSAYNIGADSKIEFELGEVSE